MMLPPLNNLPADQSWARLLARRRMKSTSWIRHIAPWKQPIVTVALFSPLRLLQHHGGAVVTDECVRLWSITAHTAVLRRLFNAPCWRMDLEQHEALWDTVLSSMRQDVGYHEASVLGHIRHACHKLWKTESFFKFNLFTRRWTSYFEVPVSPAVFPSAHLGITHYCTSI